MIQRLILNELKINQKIKFRKKLKISHKLLE